MIFPDEVVGIDLFGVERLADKSYISLVPLRREPHDRVTLLSEASTDGIVLPLVRALSV